MTQLQLQIPRRETVQPFSNPRPRRGGRNTRGCRAWLLAAIAASTLAACGGGGDSGLDPTRTYAVKAALGNLFTSSSSWALSGTANGQRFTLTMAFAPLASGPFPVNGVVSARSQETLTTQAGTQSSTTSLTVYFDPATLVFVGVEADGTCSVATSNGVLPDSAKVGASGLLFAEADLAGCTSGSAALGTSTNNWSLEADSGVALLCWNTVDTSAPPSTLSQCVQIAENGALGTKARWTATIAGTTISARNF